MLKSFLAACVLIAAAVILTSCSSKPDYDEDMPEDVDRYFNSWQDRVVVSKGLPKKSINKIYEGTWLDLKDNRDVSKNFPHTPFVTKYDPDTRVNVGPGHVPGKTKWCPICKAEVSNNEADPHFHWEENGRQMHTKYSYLEDREVGSNHVYRKTKFSREARREVVPEDYDATITKWCPVCEAEYGPGHDHDFTRYCPRCEMDVAKFGHKQEGEIHYGHVCDVTSFSKVWMVDMFRKEPRIYDKVPASKHDYAELDKALYAPDRQPRIYEPKPSDEDMQRRPENTMPGVPWVEDRAVILDRDALDKVDWKWRNPKAKDLTFELSQRAVSDVAQEVIDLIERARDPEYKWAKEKEKSQDK